MIWCLQVGDPGRPAGIAGKPIGRFWSLKAGEPGALRAGEGRCCPSAVRLTGSEATFLHLLVLFRPLMDGMVPTHTGEGPSARLSPPIRKLTSSRNILTDTLRNNIWSDIWHVVVQVIQNVTIVCLMQPPGVSSHHHRSFVW